MHVFGAVVKNKVNCTMEFSLCQKEKYELLTNEGKAARQSLVAARSCEDQPIMSRLLLRLMYCLWWAWQDALFFSRASSFIYDAGAGLGEGFDIIKGPHDHDGDLEYGLYRISFLSLYYSLSSFSSFSFAPFSLFHLFI